MRHGFFFARRLVMIHSRRKHSPLTNQHNETPRTTPRKDAPEELRNKKEKKEEWKKKKKKERKKNHTISLSFQCTRET